MLRVALRRNREVGPEIPTRHMLKMLASNFECIEMEALWGHSTAYHRCW